MNKMSKWISLMFVVITLSSCIPTPAFAAGIQRENAIDTASFKKVGVVKQGKDSYDVVISTNKKVNANFKHTIMRFLHKKPYPKGKWHKKTTIMKCPSKKKQIEVGAVEGFALVLGFFLQGINWIVKWVAKQIFKKATKRGLNIANKKKHTVYLKITRRSRSNKYYSQEKWTYSYYKDKKCKHKVGKTQRVNKMVYLKRQW